MATKTGNSVNSMFETFDHTADIGLRIQAETLETLFSEAARGLFSIIVEELSTVSTTQEIEINIKGTDQEYLFFDWLKELLFRFDVEHVLFAKFEVTLTDTGLNGKAFGEPIDLDRHELDHEVKAITYHELSIKQTDAGYQAEVIVDI